MARRPRVLAFAILVALGCTPPLTADDALPYQDCTVDSDCTFDSLSCNGCGDDIAVNAAKQVEFDEFRGCWPPSSSGSNCITGPTPAEFGCGQQPVCSQGRCAIGTNSNCQGEFTGETSGTVGGTTGCVNGSCSTGGTTFGTGGTTGTFGGNTTAGSSSASASGSTGTTGGTTGFTTSGTTGCPPPDAGCPFDGGGP